MGKIRPYYIPDPYAKYYVVVYHYGDWDRYAANALHAVYGFFWEDLCPGVTAWQEQPTLPLALLAARDWAALPQLCADICVSCRGLAWGPGVPRWNIYRGEDAATAPRCVFWDPWLGPPT